MRRSMLTLTVMAAVLLGAAAPAAADTLVGMLVDSACFTAGGGKSLLPEHNACALTCAQKGQRLGLVTLTGLVYVTGVLTLDNNAKLISLVNRPITLTGTVVVRILDNTLPIVAATIDGRRPSGSLDGVITKKQVRKGDFREGDVTGVVETTINATSVTALLALPFTLPTLP